QRQFQLDDAALEDVMNGAIEGQRLARDQDGAVLVWTTAPVLLQTLAPMPPSATAPAPLAYTPPSLAPDSVTLRRRASLRTARTPKPAIARPPPWLTNWRGARSWPTATGVAAGCMPRSANRSTRAPSWSRPSCCTVPWT